MHEGRQEDHERRDDAAEAGRRGVGAEGRVAHDRREELRGEDKEQRKRGGGAELADDGCGNAEGGAHGAGVAGRDRCTQYARDAADEEAVHGDATAAKAVDQLQRRGVSAGRSARPGAGRWVGGGGDGAVRGGERAVAGFRMRG